MNDVVDKLYDSIDDLVAKNLFFTSHALHCEIEEKEVDFNKKSYFLEYIKGCEEIEVF